MNSLEAAAKALYKLEMDEYFETQYQQGGIFSTWEELETKFGESGRLRKKYYRNRAAAAISAWLEAEKEKLNKSFFEGDDHDTLAARENTGAFLDVNIRKLKEHS